MLVVFRSLVRLQLSAVPFPPASDDFLPFMLQQNQITEFVPLDQAIFSTVLTQQNRATRPFATLFDTLQSLSSPAPAEPRPTEFIVSEAIRRFLTALEYIAPGGGLSAWGRAFLVANACADEATILFLELVRGDSMTAQYDGSEVSVPIVEIVERAFSLFETPSGCLFETTSHFSSIFNMARTALGNLLQIITCCVHGEAGGIEPLESVIPRLPFRLWRGNGSGALMRFLFESPEPKIGEFLERVEDRGQVRADIESALRWWGSMRRATEELKQRSLKPNSRVSNLRNFVVLFECADEFVRSRAESLMRWLCP
jgi:hypothetical protein